MSISKTTLGLSLGTQLTGLAILKGQELCEWQVKNFEDRWSREKLQRIVKVMEQYLSDYGVTHVRIKIPEPCRRSEALEELCEVLVSRCRTLGLPAEVYTTADLKEHCMARNRRELIGSVVRQFPELSRMEHKARQVRKVYYIRIFEAVLVATF